MHDGGVGPICLPAVIGAGRRSGRLCQLDRRSLVFDVYFTRFELGIPE